jgi:hypothetical protein
MALRLSCRWLGCCVGDFPCCERCGADLYDANPGFIENGWWPWLTTPLLRLRNRLPATRCQQCGRRLWLRRVSETFCSHQCHDAWLPF